jgi:hypothetical protein
MKKLITLLLFICPFGTMAQTDSVKVSISQETGTLEKIEIIDNSQYVLKRQEPINQLFKLQIGLTPSSFSKPGTAELNITTAGYERKFGKAFSINALIDFWTVDEGRNKSTFSAIIEPRLYLNQDVSNLSGTYIGLKFQQNISGNNYNSDTYTKSYNQQIGLSWGIQNRFLKTGLIDLGVMAGFETSTVTSPIWERTGQGFYDNKFTGNYSEKKQTDWFIRSEARIGMGFTSSVSKYKTTTCDVFRCFEAQKSWLKIDFTRMFYISESKKDINVGLDYEFKLGQSAWSINQSLRIKFKTYSHTFENYNSGGVSFDTYTLKPFWSGSYSFEPRYYYNLKKRIAYGKSANNLSANYVSLVNGLLFYKNEGGWTGSQKHTALIYGVQRRLVKNGFFDVNAGIAKVHDGTFVDGLFPRSSGLFLLLNFKVGYAIQ